MHFSTDGGKSKKTWRMDFAYFWWLGHNNLEPLIYQWVIFLLNQELMYLHNLHVTGNKCATGPTDTTCAAALNNEWLKAELWRNTTCWAAESWQKTWCTSFTAPKQKKQKRHLAWIISASSLRHCSQITNKEMWPKKSKYYLFLFNTSLSFKKALQSMRCWKTHGQSAA